MLTTSSAADDSTKQTVNSRPLGIRVLLENQSLDSTQLNYLFNNLYNGIVTEHAYNVTV